MLNTSAKPKLSLALAAATLTLGLSAPAPALAGTDPFLGEIQTFGFNFCPRGWAAADGQILPINQNQSLYSLFGTMYGGDGRTTFALPDLRGREALGFDGSTVQGGKGGTLTIQFDVNSMPPHSHSANGTNQRANKHGPGTDLFAAPYYPDGSKLNIYHDGPPTRVMDPTSIASAGGGAPITNKRSPYQTVMFCVSLTGIFPPRN